MNIGVILSAGLGIRFNSDIPKQYLKLNGREIVSYSIEAFKKAKNIDDFIVMVDQTEFIQQNIAQKYQVKTLLGGSTRNETIDNAVIFVKNNYPNCINIFFHDVARPFITSFIIDEYLTILKDYDAIVTCAKITDSIGNIDDNETLDRNNYCLIQAPEAYKIANLAKYSSPNSKVTVPLQQIKDNIKIYRYFNQKINLKITYPEDLFVAEQLIKLKFVHKDNLEVGKVVPNQNVLLLGGTGGVGSSLIPILNSHQLKVLAPTRNELNLESLSIQNINNYLKGIVPDVIINCAATYNTDDAGLSNNFDNIFNTNFKANLILIEYAKLQNSKIKIILMSSSSATRGRENLTLYSASKAALNSMIESLSNSLKEQNIFLNGIIPEKINTPLIEKLHKNEVSKKKLLDVSDITRAVIYFISMDEFGQLLHIRKGIN